MSGLISTASMLFRRKTGLADASESIIRPIGAETPRTALTQKEIADSHYQCGLRDAQSLYTRPAVPDSAPYMRGFMTGKATQWLNGVVG